MFAQKCARVFGRNSDQDLEGSKKHSSKLGPHGRCLFIDVQLLLKCWKLCPVDRSFGPKCAPLRHGNVCASHPKVIPKVEEKTGSISTTGVLARKLWEIRHPQLVRALNSVQLGQSNAVATCRFAVLWGQFRLLFNISGPMGRENY